MPKFTQTNSIGTGESYVRVPRAEVLRLNNTHITPEIAELFLLANMIPCQVEFSSRDTKRRWGTAFARSKRVILYRHTVWTFLHEVAHTIADVAEHHGPQFGQILDALYLKWKVVETNGKT